MKKLDINKDYNNGGSLYLEDGYLYKVYNEISYFREEKERNIKFLMNNSIPNTLRHIDINVHHATEEEQENRQGDVCRCFK